MKKFSYISFIFLAFIFTFKSLSFVMLSSKTDVNYELTINEGESGEEEKEEVKVKDIFEEGNLSDFSGISILNNLTGYFFPGFSDNGYFSPSFEVSSPPPELA